MSAISSCFRQIQAITKTYAHYTKWRVSCYPFSLSRFGQIDPYAEKQDGALYFSKIDLQFSLMYTS